MSNATSVDAYTATFDSLLAGNDHVLLAKQVLSNLMVTPSVVGEAAYQMELSGLIRRYGQEPQSVGKTTYGYIMDTLNHYGTDEIAAQVAWGLRLQGRLNYNYSIQNSSTSSAVLTQGTPLN